MPKKIGPWTLDQLVACQIYELQMIQGKHVGFSLLVEELDGLVSRSALPKLLNNLTEWDIVRVEYGETESGRAGRFYSITGEASDLVLEFYNRFGKEILSKKPATKASNS
ncbi:MAG: hypothetical protein ACFFER_19440 [Candidatus Thorarchaeota archaeon]